MEFHSYVSSFFDWQTTQKTPTRGPGRIGKRKLQSMTPALQSKDDCKLLLKRKVQYL